MKNRLKVPDTDAQISENRIIATPISKTPKRNKESESLKKTSPEEGSLDVVSEQSNPRPTTKSTPLLNPFSINSIKPANPLRSIHQRRRQYLPSVFFTGDKKKVLLSSIAAAVSEHNEDKEYTSATSLSSFMKTLSFIVLFYAGMGPLLVLCMLLRSPARHFVINLQFCSFTFTCLQHYWLWSLLAVCSAGVWLLSFEVINLTDNYTTAVALITFSFIQASRYGALSSGRFERLLGGAEIDSELSKEGVLGRWRKQEDAIVYDQCHYAARRNDIDNALFKLKTFKRIPEDLQSTMHSHYHSFVDYMVKKRYQSEDEDQEIELVGIETEGNSLSKPEKIYWGCTIKGVSAYLFLIFKFNQSSKYIALYVLAFLAAFLRSLLPSKVELLSTVEDCVQKESDI